MPSQKDHKEEEFISLILRVAVSSLFAVAAIGKFQKGQAGLEGVVQHFNEMFKDTWLPPQLVTLQARLIPYIEAVIPVWLISGIQLKLAWIATSFYMITLAFGIMVAGKYDVAAYNYLYVLICCWGLYFSKYDTFNVDRFTK